MRHSPAVNELEQLLAESPESAKNRVITERIKFENRKIVLFGAGTLGKFTVEKLRTVGVYPIAFADDTPEKQGTTIHDLPVISPNHISQTFGPDVLVVVTTMTAQLGFKEARSRLTHLGNSSIASFIQLAWAFPETFLPYYQFELPA